MLQELNLQELTQRLASDLPMSPETSFSCSRPLPAPGAAAGLAAGRCAVMCAGRFHGSPGWVGCWPEGSFAGVTNDITGLPFVVAGGAVAGAVRAGYRINLRWFQANPWVLGWRGTSLLTFALVFWGHGWLDDLRPHVRLGLSPAGHGQLPGGILRVV